MPLSPRSSLGEGDSYRGSPDTRLTAPSPGKQIKHITTSETELIICNDENDGSLTEISQSKHIEKRENEKDPFVTHGGPPKSGLSPTASSFSPFTNLTGTMNCILSQDMGISRYLRILAENVITSQQLNSWLQELEMNRKIFRGSKKITEDRGLLGVFFDDIRDACAFQYETSTCKPDWRASYDILIDPDLSASNNGQLLVLATIAPGTTPSPDRATAEVMTRLQSHGDIFAFKKEVAFLYGCFQGIVEYCNVSAAGAALSAGPMPGSALDIKIILRVQQEEKVPGNGYSILTQDLTGASTGPGNWEYGPASSKPYSISSPSLCLSPSLAMYPIMAQSTCSTSFPYVVNSFVANSPAAEVAPLSTPISPSYQRVSSFYRKPPSPALTVHNGFSPSRSASAYGKLDRRQHAARINRLSFQSLSSHHNHVDVHRIREGIDVRTTIMLRNIPNKVDQAMLKRIVDESSWGKYDFMYLRIDFANDCNVGYAFINFVDPLDIMDFVEARGNQRWNCFKSDKVAEVSYATIQGKDCLVQKFRNSSVMLEAAHYRPKLFYTSNGPMPEMAGEEEDFPEPDNQSKMKRSCENAEHVGLFTPNAGQHFRDEQRRRRSQYDRGTRLAALEEYDLEAIQHLYIGSERTA